MLRIKVSALMVSPYLHSALLGESFTISSAARRAACRGAHTSTVSSRSNTNRNKARTLVQRSGDGSSLAVCRMGAELLKKKRFISFFNGNKLREK